MGNTDPFIAAEVKLVQSVTSENIFPKDSVHLDQDSERFLSVRGTTRLLIRDVSVEDAGRYSCVMAFVHGGTWYNVTRNIQLRVNSKCWPSRHPLPWLHHKPAKSKLRTT